MKKVLTLIFIVITLIISGGLAYYYYFLQQEEVEVWDLVPGNAFMVYETRNINRVLDSIQHKSVWNSLKQIPYFKKAGNAYALIDSLGKDRKGLNTLLKNNRFLMSWHVTTNDAFDCAFYLDMKNPHNQETVLKMLDYFQTSQDYTYQSRTYNGIYIREIKNKANEKLFSYIFYNGIFIGSFTPYLVEDVIRNIKNKESVNFRSQVQNLFPVSRFEDDEGNLFINFQKIPLFLSSFTSNKSSSDFAFLARLCQAAFLDMKVTNNQILFTGFSVTPENKKARPTLLSTFADQEPGSIQMQGLIPEQTALFYHFYFSNPLRWEKNLTRFYNNKNNSENTDFSNNKLVLNNQYNTPSGEFFSWFAGGIGLCILESVSDAKPDKLVVINTSDTVAAQNTLSNFSEKLENERNNLSYTEKFSGYTIREIQFDNFPSTLLGKPFTGFPECYYIFVENHLVMANTIRGIKRLIKDREEENIWGKSVSQNMFLDNFTGNANISMIVNTPRVWSMLMKDLGPKWQNMGQKNGHVFKYFDKAAFQFSNSGGHFFTSATITHNPPEFPREPTGSFAVLKNETLNHPLASKPFVVQNHNNNQLEVLVQDSLKFLHLIDSEGNILWQDSLPGSIVSQVHQIDYYKNGKLQYLFATPGAIHIVDRKGRPVENFPVKLPDGVSTDYLSVIDYDNSKRYRFLVAGTNGNLYMYDKSGTNLEGWRPRSVDNRLAISPWHIRVRGKDCIMAVTQKGVIHVMHRRGHYYEGFPLDLKSSLHSKFFTEQGSNFENTTFTSVTDKGEIIAFNLKGEIVKREQLYRPSKETEFRICIDELGKTFTIARKDLHALTMLDNKGNEIFQKSYFSRSALSSDDMQVQYYNFGAGKEVFAVTDGIQDFTYLFDERGNLFNNRPIESGFPIALVYYENKNEYNIYRNYDERFSVLQYAR